MLSAEYTCQKELSVWYGCQVSYTSRIKLEYKLKTASITLLRLESHDKKPFATYTWLNYNKIK